MNFVEVVRGEVATVRLSDASNRNAMSEAMAVEFRAVVEELKGDKTVRVIVLTGAGDVFSGGGHLGMLEEKTKLSAAENESKMLSFYSAFLSVIELPVPTIAALNGHAIGAACCLSLACDMRIAASGAKLGFNFVALGLHPGMGATYLLPRLVGPAKAAELLYSGSIINADEAARLGLVNEVVPNAELQERVAKLANTIAGNGPSAIRELKESLRLTSGASLRECLAREAKCQAQDYAGAEFLEGIQAAKEKRRPKF